MNEKLPEHNVLFLGDMNFPGIDWETETMKISAASKKIQQGFIDVLYNNQMKQLVTTPTHVLGNTLDLVCTNNPAYVREAEVVSPGLSDHSIVKVHLEQRLPTTPINVRDIKLYRRANTDDFREEMQKTVEALGHMSDPDKMWRLFADNLKGAVSRHVPTKTMKQRHPSIPEWYNRKAFKLQRQQRKAFNILKSAPNDFNVGKYKHQRRTSKKELENIRKAYLTNRIFHPLKRGNSKPFFKLLDADKSKKCDQFALRDGQNRSRTQAVCRAFK